MDLINSSQHVCKTYLEDKNFQKDSQWLHFRRNLLVGVQILDIQKLSEHIFKTLDAVTASRNIPLIKSDIRKHVAVSVKQRTNE